MQKWIFALIYILFLNYSVAAKEMIHPVKKGETLYSISRMYNISLDDILTENKIEDPSKIKTGYNLKIPEKNKTAIENTWKEYIVGKGDTLYSISKNNNVEIDLLLKENNIQKNTIIKAGQKIRIPQNYTAVQEKNTEVVAKNGKNDSSNPGVNKPYMRDASHYWPVKGEMEKLSGKLQGSKISANIGDDVYSVSSGKVVWEGPYRGFGRVIFIESRTGYVYVYGGNDKTHVKVGDDVEPGSELGKIGVNVYEGTPTMFFAVYKDGQPVDVEKAPRL